MTILPDMKGTDCAAGAGGGGSVMNCCSRPTSSELSIDETSSTSSASKVTNNNFEQKQKLQFANMEANFPRCKAIDIEFENVKYTVRKFSFTERKFITKEILHGINGAFRSGEITAIMGPSGSGKSTLLNVMTGFRATGVSGTIKVNGKTVSTNSEKFRKLSCYIHQDDLLRPQLTVGETMILAAHLKLGFGVTKEHKLQLINHILSLLGLDHRVKVYTAKLSGGQKKRLAIALELISNPPVLYLDEPTTGLDSSSCSQCVYLLQRLAAQGHTIVCTIHQPSALVFEMFNKLYTVVDGNCIYQGPVREVVPFLRDQQLICPSYHNPADFLLEVAVGEHERDLEKLIKAANKKYFEDADLYPLNRVNGIIEQIKGTIDEKPLDGTKKKSLFGFITNISDFPAYDYVKPSSNELALEEVKGLTSKTQAGPDNQLDLVDMHSNNQNNVDSLPKPNHKPNKASFFMQYLLLLQRIIMCTRRNYFLLLARLLSHVCIGVLFGYLYLGVGDKATTVLGNYVYLYGSTLLLVYTGKMAVVLTFPLEIGMLTREHFNRWYNLGPYFLALISFEIPFQSLCAFLYMLISIHLTGNYSAEPFRFYYFILLGVMATLSAQAWGFFVGATLPVKLAVFLGPILAVLFSVFGFCTRYIDITPVFRWMWHISYFRAGFHGVLNAIYGLDRQTLKCPENIIYCHFNHPKVFLDYMMIQDVNMRDCIVLMGGVIAVMHLLTLITLWHKLNKR